jgi:hypothetical protein
MLLLSGCCGYSTHSLLPSHLKTVAVPPATNTTTQPGLDQALTDSLTAAFASDRTLHVTNVEAADLVVNTTVSNYARTPAAYTGGDTTGNQAVTAYELSVSAQVDVRDQTRDEAFYSGVVSAQVTYDPNPPNAKTEEQAAAEAVKKLASEIVRQVLIAW